MPRVSVIMGVLNGERYLADAVNSVLGQTLRDLELIIVNDGSTDETAPILDRVKDKRVRIFHNEKNLGHAPSLNKAIGFASGEYIARQDADDISMPERLARQVSYLDASTDVALLGTGCGLIDEDGKVLGSWGTLTNEIDIRWSLLFFNPFIHSSVMLRRAVLDQAGGYSEDPAISTANVEDYDLWSRIAERFEVANLADRLVKYRSHSQSVSILTSDKQNLQRDRIALRNIRTLARLEVQPSVWQAVRMFLFSNVSEKVDLPFETVRQVLSFLETLLRAFHERHRFAQDVVEAHRRRLYRLWGRRCLSLSYRNNEHRTLASRSALITQGVRLFGRVVLPPPVNSI